MKSEMLETKKSWFKIWEILVEISVQPNYETGGARQAAVAQQPMHVWKVRFLKNLSFIPGLFIKLHKAPEVKLSCFKGIGNPTDIHGSWGTWLVTTQPDRKEK